MFLFGKKKSSAKEETVQKPEINTEELLQKAEELKAELDNALDKEQKAKLLTEIGSCYFQAEDTEQAIYYYEQSLEENKQLGRAYTDLLKLYNQKRQEAAEAKDDEKIKEYMDKVQGLMQLSKDVLRGKV
ncbi:tetratricopeptide repeat protein [Mediterraneibacter sp. NSJ-55]|uniref:Tetratricopeptide repeat protein n=1 Tax=Mediterraneibacter hominis TaxID=2763054 RepID=A0A923LII7_9FIRM|nr:tetratricopeptide repeat protein [Mediterraneibacter hominis]MBC5688894.1 tetratricopeptide repeat protein [Mediterraneibacter hominis]